MRITSSDALLFRWLDDLRRDAAYAVRSLSRSPGFTAAALLTLSVGIGAATAIYSVVDSILLRPLPFADPDRLVRVVENAPPMVAGRPPRQRRASYEEFLEWRARTKTLSDTVAIISLGQRLVRTSEGTARLWGGMTSANAFTVLGARAMLGRTLLPGDDGNPNVVVLSFDTWRRFFHSEPGIVGTTIELRAPEPMMRNVLLEARLLAVVGVLPAGFEGPTGPMDFYMPVVLDDAAKRAPAVDLIGRLRPGVSLKAATDEANVIGSAIRPPPSANAPPLTVPRFEVQGLKDGLSRGCGLLFACCSRRWPSSS